MAVSEQTKNSLIGSCMALFATIAWAGNFIAAKMVAPEMSAYEINFWRWFFASVIMLPMSLPYLKNDWSIIKSEYKLLFFYGFMGVFLSNLLFYNAPKTAPAVDMTILMAVSPIFMMLFARILFKDHINNAWIIGSLISFFGVITLVTKGNYFSLMDTKFTEGHFWTLGCALCFALYSVCMRLLKAQMHLTVFLQVTFTIGTFFSAISLLFDNNSLILFKNISLSLPLLYMAVGASVVAFLLWNTAIKKIGAVRAGIIYYLVPVFGSFFAVVFLGETINSMQILGGTLVLGGVVFCSLSRKKAIGTKGE